jgi:signal transduction histidine kinase
MSASLAESEYSRKRMISDIAHELRTPLSVMRGQLEGMMDGVINADTQHIGTVYNQTLQLSRLVADLWTLTRAEAKSLSLEKSPTDLEEFIDNISREFEPLAQDGLIQLQVQVEPNLPRITLDQGRMRQVLSNLLVNALRHTPQGGQITLLAGCRDSKMVMSVGDTGEGLSSEDVQHIFERFFRTDRSRQRQYGGAGLGLAIARELVVLHGGDIAVESRIGLGTSFTITLPFV